MRRRDFLGGTLAGAFALYAERSEAGACAPMSPRPFVWSDPSTPLPPDGAVVLALQTDMGLHASTNSELFPSQITLAGLRDAVTFRTHAVAPSVRLLVPAHAPRGAVTVRGIEARAVYGATGTPGPVRLQFDGTARPLLAAPALSEVTVRAPSPLALGGGPGGPPVNAGPMGRFQQPPRPQHLALFATPPPPDAAFLVVAMAGRAGAPFQGFCAAPLAPNARSVTLYQHAGRCGPRSPDNPPSQGMSVVAVFVDRYGRLSPPSTALTVTSS